MMKKVISIIIASLTSALLLASVVYAAYPSSRTELPEGSRLLDDKFIGEKNGWDGSEATGFAAAFDGRADTYYDPTSMGGEGCYCGVKLAEAAVLTKVCILPRKGQAARFEGASIQGSNDGKKWTTLWQSKSPGTEDKWETITQFKNNRGYRYYRYFNSENHGDIAELELYGYSVSGAYAAAGESVAVGEITVFLDANGGRVAAATVKTSFGGAYPALPEPDEREGYVFEGWYSHPDGGIRISEGSAVTKPENHTLYARWVNADGASGDASGNAVGGNTAVSPVPPVICITIALCAPAIAAIVIISRRQKKRQ